MGLHHCTDAECPYIGQTTTRGCRCHKTDEQVLRERNTKLTELLAEARRAIGNHFAPDDCYATGPRTGDVYRDLVQCPACSFIAMYDEAEAS